MIHFLIKNEVYTQIACLGPLVWKDKQGQNALGGVHRGTFNLNAYNKRLPPNYVAEYIRVIDFVDWIKEKQAELM